MSSLRLVFRATFLILASVAVSQSKPGKLPYKVRFLFTTTTVAAVAVTTVTVKIVKAMELVAFVSL